MLYARKLRFVAAGRELLDVVGASCGTLPLVREAGTARIDCRSTGGSTKTWGSHVEKSWLGQSEVSLVDGEA